MDTGMNLPPGATAPEDRTHGAATTTMSAHKALLFGASTYHYKSRRPGQAALEQRIREICETRVRLD